MVKKNKSKKKLIITIIFVIILLIIATITGISFAKHKQIQAEKQAQIELEKQTKKEAKEQAKKEAKEQEKKEASKETDESTQQNNSAKTGKVICLDPGHQRRGDSTSEPNGPGSSTMKARVTGGTTGRFTGIPEYQETLTVGLQLKAELEKRGYTVYMTRETNDVNISNKERAEYAKKVGANIVVRLHCNGIDSPSVSGALTMAPSTNNRYCSSIASESQRLAKNVINSYCQSTGMKNQGVSITDTMTGLNWCTCPATIIEMGYMTNQSDDTRLNDPSFQAKMVQGIANGIDAYFGL